MLNCVQGKQAAHALAKPGLDPRGVCLHCGNGSSTSAADILPQSIQPAAVRQYVVDERRQPGEGGTEEIAGVRRVTAPPLGSVIPRYSDAELLRLILHGVKRDGRSAIGMSSYTFWLLGDVDVANIILFLRLQPPADDVERVRQIPFLSRLKLLQGKWWLSADQVNTAQPRWGNMPRRNAYERGRFLAAVICAEGHGADYRGDPLEGGPPLTILAIYVELMFARLMQTSELLAF